MSRQAGRGVDPRKVVSMHVVTHFLYWWYLCQDEPEISVMNPYRRIADVCFELHFRVTPGQFRSAAASSLHRRLAILATSTRPSFSKNAYLGILFAPMYQKYSLYVVSFGFYSNIQIV